MSASIASNFEPDFEKSKSAYTEKYPFDQVIFPTNAPLLAQNLNEMQQIIDKKISSISASMLTDGIIPVSGCGNSIINGSILHTNFYTVNSDALSITEGFYVVYSGKMYYVAVNSPADNVYHINNSAEDGTEDTLYLCFLTNVEFNSKSGVVASQIPFLAGLDNYLFEDFADFEGKELSKRRGDFLPIGFSVNEPNEDFYSRYIEWFGGTPAYIPTLTVRYSNQDYTINIHTSSSKIPSALSVSEIIHLQSQIQSINKQIDAINNQEVGYSKEYIDQEILELNNSILDLSDKIGKLDKSVTSNTNSVSSLSTRVTTLETEASSGVGFPNWNEKITPSWTSYEIGSSYGYRWVATKNCWMKCSMFTGSDSGSSGSIYVTDEYGNKIKIYDLSWYKHLVTGNLSGSSTNDFPLLVPIRKGQTIECTDSPARNCCSFYAFA